MAVHLILSLAAQVLCCTLWGRRINRGIVRSWDNAALQSCWINHSPVVAIHPFIHPPSQPVIAFVTSQLYEPHPVINSPGIKATAGAWLTGVTGENVPQGWALSCFCSCDFNSEKYKDTNWKERRAGDLSSGGNAPWRIVSLSYRDVLYSF